MKKWYRSGCLGIFLLGFGNAGTVANLMHPLPVGVRWFFGLSMAFGAFSILAAYAAANAAK